jgi:NAD(P)-dependent dehydrogenase (short-subunit alcohol dehydrogenase family)
MAVVLITGCSSGIGLETALAFARRGDRVYASMRNPAKADRLHDKATTQGLNIDLVTLDVTDTASVTAAVDAIEAVHGAIDVVVNNAGVAYQGPVELADEELARVIFETNVWGPVRLVRAVLPAMRARRSGVIVNVSSTGGRLPGFLYNGFYFASKKALGSLSESLAWELEPLGIRVMCIEPGLFATQIFDNSHWFDPRADNPYMADQTWFTAAMTNWVATGAADPAIAAAGIVAALDDPATPLHVMVDEDAIALVDIVTEAGTFERAMPALNQMLESMSGPRPRQSRAVLQTSPGVASSMATAT